MVSTRTSSRGSASTAPAPVGKREPSTMLSLQSQFIQMTSVTCPPGPAFIPQYVIINFQKGGTLFYCLLLMWYFQNFSYQAMVYTVAHGSYGFVWLLKHYVMRDRNWDKKCTVLGIFNSFAFVLGPYWAMPYMLISHPPNSPDMPSMLRTGASLFVCILGMVIMMIADAQKYYILKVKRGLITDGMFTYVRHPNYLGEMLLYGSFACLMPTCHLAKAWGILLFVWLLLFSTNIRLKEISMSRYPEWSAYVARSGLLLPPLSSLRALFP